MQKDYLFQSGFLERNHELLGWFTYPLFMIGFTVLYFWGLQQGFALDTWVVTVTVINFFTTLLFEQLLPRNRAMNYLHDGQSLNDIGHGMMQAASRAAIQSSLILVFAFLNELRLETFGQLWPTQWNFVAQFLLGAADSKFYGLSWCTEVFIRLIDCGISMSFTTTRHKCTL